jgi:hypothetical protein
MQYSRRNIGSSTPYLLPSTVDCLDSRTNQCDILRKWYICIHIFVHIYTSGSRTFDPVFDFNISLNLAKAKLHSYEGECHTIPLTLRVNRNTDIELFLSRITVNNYDFMSLTLFAFSISHELRAEYKRKCDTRWREFWRKGSDSQAWPTSLAQIY